MMASSSRTPFLHVFLTLATYVVLGPLIGSAFALLIIVPVAVAGFGVGMVRAIGGLLLGNPWLPYYYGLVPAALTGIVIVFVEARIGPPTLRLVTAVGALAGIGSALVTDRAFSASNPMQLALYTASCVVAALGSHLLLRAMRRAGLP